MPDMLRVDIDSGKYTIIQDESGKLSALRHGEPWRDLVGDNLVGAMAYEIDDLRSELRASKDRVEELERAADLSEPSIG